uniref:Decapping nuclease n=1 Tax=Strongyloides stercoralis TaxID=6248 RepID=A0A0K0DTI4_STRER
MASIDKNNYISKPICINEISLDRFGNILQHKSANKCYLFEKFINQDIFYINLKSHKILYEGRTTEMELNLRRNILKNLLIPGYTLKKSLCGAEFYCSSGILRKFALSHLQHYFINVWCIKLDGVIVMVDSDTLEVKNSSENDDITLSSNDNKTILKQNEYDLKKLHYDKILKYAAFFKKNYTDNKKVFIDGIYAWKQYRRVYITELNCPTTLNERNSIKIAYNSIIHCVDEKTDKPVLIKTKPSYISEENFIWRLNQVSKMYMETILLDSEKIVIGECDKNLVIHHTTIKTPKEIFEKIDLNEKNLFLNLSFVLNKIKSAFEAKSSKPVKCVNVVKSNVRDRYHVSCYADIPNNEACIKVFDNF